MEVKIIIDGNPQGKGRPRFLRRTGTAYTPKETKDYEDKVKKTYLNSENPYIFEGQLCAEINAYYPIPKPTKKKDKELMLQGIILPTKKPDLDNVAKIILDSLNDIAYHDDSQVVSLTINKFYSEEPRVELRLWQ
jgi:Holliday junction resolvase RusA-like endonuclease